MRQRRIALLLIAASAAALAARAEPRSFRVASGEGRAQVRLVYSLGTHQQDTAQVSGALAIDLETLASAQGVLSVPIAAIAGDHGARDCHMRESLGLDYAAANFPEEHSCDGDDKLPAAGRHAVVYPEIRFELSGARPLDDVKLLAEGKPVRVEVDGRWTLHGQTRPAKLLLRVAREGTGLRVRGRGEITLADYGVKVKPAKVLFASITAGEVAGLELQLLLEEAAPAPPAAR